MKSYMTITNSNQVKTNDILCDFRPSNTNEIWNTYTVAFYTKNGFMEKEQEGSDGIVVQCKSGALMTFSNERLESKRELSKRVY